DKKMNKKKLKVCFAITLVFAAGFGTGWFCTNYIRHQHRKKLATSTPEVRAEMILRKLSHKLSLNKDQDNKVFEIVLKGMVQFDVHRDQVIPKLQALHEISKQSILKELTAKQVETFKKLRIYKTPFFKAPKKM
ncbi:hypothetical protein MJH12_03250, partial [bacterium]|nr:hypothetical protein [bacterium]